MSAEGRLGISKRKATEDYLKTVPTSVLSAFFASDAHTKLKKELNLAFSTAFEVDLAFDYSRGITHGFRVGNSTKRKPAEPRELGRFFEREGYRELDTEGDGYRSFVSTILGLLTTAPRVLFLDEPEAFLHQAQAETLGKMVAQLSKANDQQVFVATHSAAFLWGLLKEEPDASVLRVKRTGERSNVHLVESKIISKIFENPILASQRVLDALFYDDVMVCEGDSDRVVYEHVLSKKFDRKNLLVTNTIGKQNAVKVARFSRDLGAKSVAVVDIDFLNDRTDVTRAIEAFDLGEKKELLLEMRQLLDDEVSEKCGYVDAQKVIEIIDVLGAANADGQMARDKVRRASNDLRNASKGWDRVKAEGVPFWKDQSYEAKEALSTFASAGLFACKNGELEQWFPEIGTSRKSEFTEKALVQIDLGNVPLDLEAFLSEIIDYFNADEG